jgi:hypothetical protein
MPMFFPIVECISYIVFVVAEVALHEMPIVLVRVPQSICPIRRPSRRRSFSLEVRGAYVLALVVLGDSQKEYSAST